MFVVVFVQKAKSCETICCCQRDIGIGGVEINCKQSDKIETSSCRDDHFDCEQWERKTARRVNEKLLPWPIWAVLAFSRSAAYSHMRGCAHSPNVSDYLCVFEAACVHVLLRDCV